MDGVQDPRDVHVHHGLPFREFGLLQRVKVPDARIRNQGIEASPALHLLFPTSLDLVCLRHVASRELHEIWVCRAGFLQLCEVAGGQKHTVTGFRQRNCSRCANARRGTGDPNAKGGVHGVGERGKSRMEPITAPASVNR